MKRLTVIRLSIALIVLPLLIVVLLLLGGCTTQPPTDFETGTMVIPPQGCLELRERGGEC